MAEKMPDEFKEHLAQLESDMAKVDKILAKCAKQSAKLVA